MIHKTTQAQHSAYNIVQYNTALVSTFAAKLYRNPPRFTWYCYGIARDCGRSRATIENKQKAIAYNARYLVTATRSRALLIAPA